MAMVRDLQEGAEQLVSNDITAALAGDMDAKESVGAKAQNPDPKEFDTIPPQSEFLILDRAAQWKSGRWLQKPCGEGSQGEWNQ
jgi:hypothetical protein